MATFEQECQFHLANPNPIVAFLEYVGWVEEILEVDF
jgi:hypothetical protein